MSETRWCLDFSYAESSKRWQGGAVFFHPLSGDTFELNCLADDILRYLDVQHAQTTESLISQLTAVYGDVEDLPLIVRDTLCFLQDQQLVCVL